MDLDGDGYGDLDSTVDACERPDDAVANRVQEILAQLVVIFPGFIFAEWCREIITPEGYDDVIIIDSVSQAAILEGITPTHTFGRYAVIVVDQ